MWQIKGLFLAVAALSLNFQFTQFYVSQSSQNLNGLDQNETVHVRRRRIPIGLYVLRHHRCHRSGIQRELLGLVISAAGAAVLCSRGVLWHPRGDSPREWGRRLPNLGP